MNRAGFRSSGAAIDATPRTTREIFLLITAVAPFLGLVINFPWIAAVRAAPGAGHGAANACGGACAFLATRDKSNRDGITWLADVRHRHVPRSPDSQTGPSTPPVSARGAAARKTITATTTKRARWSVRIHRESSGRALERTHPPRQNSGTSKSSSETREKAPTLVPDAPRATNPAQNTRSPACHAHLHQRRTARRGRSEHIPAGRRDAWAAWHARRPGSRPRPPRWS